MSREAAGPVLLHCASSNRVSGVYEMAQALKGKSLAEAEAAGSGPRVHEVKTYT